MRYWRFLVLALALGFWSASPAQAYRFGTDESIEKIEDVTLKGPKDEKLFLGHMVRTRWFLAGLYVEDVGYVLGVEGEGKRFFNMPEGEQLAGFQRNGFLPSPLPPYKISIFDYILGYSLWWGLVIVGLVVWYGDGKKKAAAAAQQEAVPAGPGAPAAPAAPAVQPSAPPPPPGAPIG